MPINGMKRDKYLNFKFGSQEKALSVYKKIEDEGKLENIYFQFDKIKITPNSFLSHKLLAFAYNRKKQSEVLESLFYHYFIEGENIGNFKSLIQIAKQTKIYEEGVENYLLSNEDTENLLNESKQANIIGIKGVPCFIFNKEFVLNGAQPKVNFEEIINTIAKNV